MLIIDSHAHYDDLAFDNDRDSLLENLPQNGIYKLINVSSSLQSSKESIKISEKYDYIYNSVGIHPLEVESDCKKDYSNILKNFLSSAKNVAIGEIGLDYHYSNYDKNLQRKIFEDQILIAIENNLPVIIHTREASKDTIEILKFYKPMGVIHCFSGDMNFLDDVLKLNLKIGVGGIITFKNSKELIEVIKETPIENILLETDAPYLAPVPFRGKRCDSSMIKYTAEKLADIKGLSLEQICQITTNNSLNFFNINN